MGSVIFGQRVTETLDMGRKMPVEHKENSRHPSLDMDFEEKTPDAGTVRESEPNLAEVLEPNSATSDELRNLQALRTEELGEAMLSADVDRIIRLNAELSSFPVRIEAAELREIKATIEEWDSRLKEIKQEVEDFRQIHNEKGFILAQKKEELDGLQSDYNRVGVTMTGLEMESRNLHSQKFELNQELEARVKSAKQIQEKK